MSGSIQNLRHVMILIDSLLPADDPRRMEVAAVLADAADRKMQLRCMESGGVDNWEYVSDALRDGGYFAAEEAGRFEPEQFLRESLQQKGDYQ